MGEFLYGHTHDEAVQAYIIIPVILIAILLALFKNRQPKWLFTLFLINLALSFWYAFWYWEGWQPLKESISVLNTFNFARIHFMDPPIWYIAFALALLILWQLKKSREGSCCRPDYLAEYTAFRAVRRV